MKTKNDKIIHIFQPRMIFYPYSAAILEEWFMFIGNTLF